MNIAQAIMYLYPQATPLIDFEVRDDSDDNGAYLAEWNIDAPQPTEDELLSAWNELLEIPITSLSEMDILGEQIIQREIESMELRNENEMLGQQIIQLELRLLEGGY